MSAVVEPAALYSFAVKEETEMGDDVLQEKRWWTRYVFEVVTHGDTLKPERIILI